MADITRLQRWVAHNLEKRITQYERRIASQLRAALIDIRGEMSVIYDKYSVNGMLTNAEMSRYARYSSMETQMLSALDPGLKNTILSIKRLGPDVYKESFFNHAWMMDNAASVRINWGVMNMNSIRASFAIDDPTNRFMRIALKAYGPDAKNNIRTALTKGLTQGKSYPDMARDLKDAVNRTNYQAMRIVRTEGQTALQAGANDVYDQAEKQGIEGKVIWMATLDARTRDQHRQMDGKERGGDGMFTLPNGEKAPYPGFEGLSAENRIQCRCSIRYEIDGYAPQLRRTRDQGLINYQDYNTWEKNYGPKIH